MCWSCHDGERIPVSAAFVEGEERQVACAVCQWPIPEGPQADILWLKAW